MPKVGQLPGTTINQKFRPGTGSPRDYPRYCGFVAKSTDLKLFRDQEHIRGQQEGVQLFFSGVTYIAPLSPTAVPDKNRSRLYTSDGRSIPRTRWNFAESTPGTSGFDQISIDPAIFSSGESYFIDYVSDDAAVQDEVLVDDLREVTALGDNASQIQYSEGTDYRFITTATGPTPGTDNLNPTASAVTAIAADAANTGTGTLAHNSSTYTHGYNRAYVAEVTAAAGVSPNRTATIRVEVYPTSSGFTDAAGRTLAMENQIDIDLDEAVPASLTDISVEYGITLDFAFGGTHFVVGDIFTFNGVGPGVVELADALQNTNQFSTTTAVVDGGTNTGEGSVTVNPQSLYNGLDNSPYELEVTAAAGSGSSRTATFRWRTTSQLLALTGTATATNAVATVAGTGSEFASEVVAGDLLFIGDDPRPVTVLSVTDSTNLTLDAVYPFATKGPVKVLRYRARTGSITVPIASSTRVTLDSGVLLDFDYGPTDPDNFDVGDTFSFTALAARLDYNGKENRNYDLTVTDTSTLDHTVTMSYSGNTALSGFGSWAFSEGNPLVLANNITLHARNMSLDGRFDAVAPADEFDLSLTFDGLIDWTLTQVRSEPVASTDILTDLTGAVTGTVGASYIILRYVPTTVHYVRGPSPTFTNYSFSQVAGTNILYFTSDPGVNLTVRYEWAGLEPEAGATYFMSGYQKRPSDDYNSPNLFLTKDAANDFLAPMTRANDAAIANQIAWSQDELSLPGVVAILVNDADGDGTYTTADYRTAITVSEQFKGTMDCAVVNQFAAREEFRDSVINMNDPTVFRQRIGYFGFPTNYPIGDEFTPDTRVYVARRELQVFQDSVARGTLAIIGNSYATLTILVDSIGNQDTIGTTAAEVTVDGSFLAVALAARVASFNEPWESVYNLSVSGFNSIEPLEENEMIQLLNAGIIPIRVEGGSGFYVGTVTTDETEASTQQLSGTTQRQYVLARLRDVLDRRVIGLVADSPEEAAQLLKSEVVSQLGAMVSEKKIGSYLDADTNAARPLDPDLDVVAFRDARDPTRAYFRASWYQRYPILYIDGLVAVDAATP